MTVILVDVGLVSVKGVVVAGYTGSGFGLLSGLVRVLQRLDILKEKKKKHQRKTRE